MMHKDFFIRNIPQGSLCAAVWFLNNKQKSSEEQTMHMADALLSPAVAVTMYAASAAAAGVSLVQLRREELAALRIFEPGGMQREQSGAGGA